MGSFRVEVLAIPVSRNAALAAYLGAAVSVPPGLLVGALIALVAILLPGVLIPFWRTYAPDRKRKPRQGVNAAVVGLLGPLFTNRFGQARSLRRWISPSHPLWRMR